MLYNLFSCTVMFILTSCNRISHDTAMRLFDRVSLVQTEIDTSVTKASQSPTLLRPAKDLGIPIGITRATRTQNPCDHQLAERSLGQPPGKRIGPQPLWVQH